MPPNQAETMVAALTANGVPYAYLAFEGEQHGFRHAETEIRCLEAELYFYGRILGFEPADELEPVEIDGCRRRLGRRRPGRPGGWRSDRTPGSRGTLATLKRTAAEFMEDNLTDWAAALTYYGLLSLFPALIALVSLLGLFGDPQSDDRAA